MRDVFPRTVLPLSVCQAILFAANTIVVSTTALVGAQLAPHVLLTTLPMGLQFLGMVSASLPMSLVMGRLGRRVGFSAGAAFGMTAGLLGALAIGLDAFWLFCVATWLYGTYAGTSGFFRFAASEAAPEEVRPRAISWVLVGGVLAAFVGPRLADASAELVPAHLYAGCYLAITALTTVMLATVQVTRFAPTPSRRAAAGGRPLAQIVRQPRFLVALGGAAVGQSSMSFLMVSTPLAMLGCGHAFGDATTVIQWHVVGMFAPSFVTGSIIRRVGAEPVIAAGAGLILAAVAVGTQGLAFANFWGGLVLLGVGWNFMYVGGTTLLTTTYTPQERARVEGVNETCLFATAVAASTSSGAALDQLGWHAMNLVVVVPLTLVLVGLALAARRAPRPA
jgi:MFS family permease